jgi:hypothetical protein
VDDVPAASLVDAQFWIGRTPWRPAAFWCVVAGLLASGLAQGASGLAQGASGLAQGASGLAQEWARFDGKTVVLIVLLADVVWGALWRMAGGRSALLALPATQTGPPAWLPYLQADSPAARLFTAEEPNVWAYALRAGGPALFLALLISATLGSSALLLTGAAMTTAALGWAWRRYFGSLPALLASLATVGLPWALALMSAGNAWNSWQWLAQLALLALWVIHQWGAGRLLAHGHDWVGLGLTAVAQLGVCVLLIVSQTPLWVALIVLLLLPTWLAVTRQQPLQRQQLLWLGAMLVSAFALGQTM